MDIQAAPTRLTERPTLRHLMKLCQYDFSEFDGTELGQLGLYNYPYLA